MLQYFRLIGLVLLLSVGMGSLGSAESESTEPDTFNRRVGVDLFGDDLTSNGVKGISLAECETLCLNDNSCKAYSFVNDKQWCFPKHGVGEAQDNVKVSSGTRELPLSCEDGASNMAEVYQCLDDQRALELTNIFDELSAQLLSAGLSDKLQFLQSSQNAWTADTKLYCHTLLQIAQPKLGLYANDIQSNCFGELTHRRIQDLSLLLNALIDENFEHWQ